MFSAFYYLQYCILSMYIILSIYVYFQYVYNYMYVQYVYYTTCTGVLLKFEYYLFDLFHSSSSAIGYMVTVNIFF